MIGGTGRWRSLLGPIGGQSVPLLPVFVILRAVLDQEDVVTWYMGKRQDGFRDRPVDHRVLGMQGLEDFDRYLPQDILLLKTGLNWSGPLLATSCKGPNIYGCRIGQGKEQETVERQRNRDRNGGLLNAF